MRRDGSNWSMWMVMTPNKLLSCASVSADLCKDDIIIVVYYTI